MHWKLTGEDEESAEAGAFLVNAFGAAIFLIFAVLLAQFNKLSSVGLILFAIILSTIGVFLGLMIMGQPFGIVMNGIGIIALAGIVTNNNIVLIDTYDRLRREGVPVEEAILRTCRERARPVLLTAGAAVLGVLPIAFGLNVNFVHREITIGAPSTQWWIQLSTAIVFGLALRDHPDAGRDAGAARLHRQDHGGCGTASASGSRQRRPPAPRLMRGAPRAILDRRSRLLGSSDDSETRTAFRPRNRQTYAKRRCRGEVCSSTGTSSNTLPNLAAVLRSPLASAPNRTASSLRACSIVK